MFLLKIMLAFILYLAGSVALPLAWLLLGFPEEPLLTIIALGGALSLFPLTPLYLVERRKAGAFRGFSRWGKKSVFWLLLGGSASCTVLNSLISLSGLMERFPSYTDELSFTFYSPPLLHQLISLGILIPLTEEMVFRGFLFRQLRMKLSWAWAALIASLIFALFHGNIPQGIYALLMGLAMCWVFQRLGGLWASCLFHISANLCSVLLANVTDIHLSWPIWFLSAGLTVLAFWQLFTLTDDEGIVSI